jgi:hypothetical protein
MAREITCVKKRDRTNVHEHIVTVGGIHLGISWRKSQFEVITDIENRWESYYVMRQGHTVSVMVAVSIYGHKYIKTETDGIRADNLLSLPDC